MNLLAKKLLYILLFFVSQISLGASRVIYEQGFEDIQYFSTLTTNGYTAKDSLNGLWGVFRSDQAVSISNTKTVAGSYSLKVTRMATTQTNAIGFISKPLSPTNTNILEVWVYRPTGSEFVIFFSGLNASYQATNVAVLSTAETGKFFIRNATETNLRTYVPMPANVWVLVRMTLNWVTKRIEFNYDLNGITTKIGNINLTGNDVAIDRVIFGANVSPAGSSTYFDSLKISEGDVLYFNSEFTGDFRLPVYRSQSHASLELTGAGTISPFAAKVRVTPEKGGAPVEEKQIVLSSGNQTITFDLNSYVDGRYIVTIAPEDTTGIHVGTIKRLLRVDKTGITNLPVEPITVSGQKVFPVDDFHFVQREGVVTQVKPVDQVIQASRPLAQDRPVQISSGSTALNYDEQGNFVMYFYDANRTGGDQQYHFTYSKDLKNWQIADQSPTGQPNKSITTPYAPIPSSAVPSWGMKTKITEANVIFYDAARDGIPPLKEVRVQWFPPSLVDATQYGLVSWGTYPVWEKRQGEWLVLTREPLVVDKFMFEPEELETELSSNDNFGTQFLSDDGKTLFYPRAAKLRRFSPYTVEYDNISQAHRIMRTHYTHDGINWETKYLVLPDENDHWSYQHYGVHIFRVDKDYYLGYLHAYHCVNQQIYTEVIYSRDGLNWKRIPGSMPFISNGGIGSWTFGLIFTQAAPLELNGKYYLPLGQVKKHQHFYVTPGKEDVSFVTANYLQGLFGERNLTEQWPYFNEIGGWEGLANDMLNYHASVGLATFRKDGWMVVKAEARGEMLSRVLTAEDNNLRVNALTGKDGDIKIEILNSDGTPIDAYCGANAAIYKGDGTDVLIKWSKGTVSGLPDVPFRLKISMNKAEIYSLNFVVALPASTPLPFITTWKTDNAGQSNTNQIIIPATGTYTAYWENMVGSFNGQDTITFSAPGTYQLEIFPGNGFGFAQTSFDTDGITPTGDQTKLIDVTQWGNYEWTTARNMFNGCKNMTNITATDLPTFSVGASMESMFQSCHLLSHINRVEEWDTRNITSLNKTFAFDVNFNQNLNNWNVTNVTTLERMFWECRNFNQPLNNWYTANVTDMLGVFSGALAFNQALDRWDVSKVTRFSQMFKNASSFNQSLGSWIISNVSPVTDTITNQSLTEMFNNSGMDIHNYGETLIEWAGNINTAKNVILGAAGMTYANEAVSSRGILIKPVSEGGKNWSILGDMYSKLTNSLPGTNQKVGINLPVYVKNVLNIYSQVPIKSITIYHLDGSVVMREYNVSSLFVSSLKEGLFLVEVEGTNGVIVRGKIIKE